MNTSREILTCKLAPDLVTASIIESVIRVLHSNNLTHFLIGATARDIVLHNVFGVEATRKTRDVDFAFAVKNWGQLDTVKGALEASRKFLPSGIAHRMIFPANIENRNIEVLVDFVPYGGIEDNNNHIAWPPNGSTKMNVTGFQDVEKATLQIALPCQAWLFSSFLRGPTDVKRT